MTLPGQCLQTAYIIKFVFYTLEFKVPENCDSTWGKVS